MGVASPTGSLSSPAAADPADDDLDSGWDGEPVASAASKSIAPATDAIDSDWLDDNSGSLAASAPTLDASKKPAAFVPPAPAKSMSPTSATDAASSTSKAPASPPADAKEESRPLISHTPSPPRSVTPVPRASGERPSARTSSVSGTRPVVRSGPVQARPLTASHPPEAVAAEKPTSKLADPKQPASTEPAASEKKEAGSDKEGLPSSALAPPPPSSRAVARANAADDLPPSNPFAPNYPFAPNPSAFDVAKLSLPPPSDLVETGATETFRPSHVDRPLSIPAPRGRARFVQSAVVLCALALAGTAWLKLRPQAQREARPLAVSTRAAVPAAQPAQPPQPAVAAVTEAPATPPKADPPAAPENSNAPDSAPSGAASGAPPPANEGPDLTSAFAAALSASPGSIAVTVRVTPAGSIIFDHGKRIGTDTVTVNVEPGGKKNLVALLDGYLPRRFVVDGSLNSVAIALRPALPGAPTPAAPTANPMAPAQPPAAQAPAAAPARPAAPPPKKAGPKEAFDPSRDVGAL